MLRVIYHPTDPAKNQYMVDGKLVTREEFEARSPSRLDFNLPPGGQRPACWPMYSDAMGVHPDQVPEAHAESLRIGIPTDFLDDGRVIFRDSHHRKEYVRAHHMRDRNGGYSDP